MRIHNNVYTLHRKKNVRKHMDLSLEQQKYSCKRYLCKNRKIFEVLTKPRYYSSQNLLN